MASGAAIWDAILVTLRLASLTALLLALLGVPLAYWLAMGQSRFRSLVEAVVTLPTVLPPTVLGYYLLVAFAPQSLPGRLFRALTGTNLAFSFWGILVASVIFSAPFALRPYTVAFQSIDRRLLEVSWCLGLSRWRTFWAVVLPLAWHGVLSGTVLAFCHAVGAFGVILMVGGNIPGRTRTLSVLIYDLVQALEYGMAGRVAAGLVLFALCVLLLVHWLNRRATGYRAR